MTIQRQRLATASLRHHRRYYAAVLADRAPRVAGFGKHVEVKRYRHARRSGPKNLYVWYFDKLIGPKKFFEFAKVMRDRSSQLFQGHAGELSHVAIGAPKKTAKRATARSSSATRGVKRRALSEAKTSSEKSLTPPAAVAKAARDGLQMHRDGFGGKGLTEGAISRARVLAKRGKVKPETMRMMRAWFARHAVDKRPGWNKRKTPGWVAWQLWGGDAARTWVRGVGGSL